MAVSDAWPFDQEFYIILNLAMGGSMGGTIDPGFTSDTFEIDYVRVYQRDYVTDDAGNPMSPTNLEVANANGSTAYVTWTKSTDDKQVRQYNLYLDGAYLKSVSLNVAKLTGLIAGTEYLVEIEAEDYAGHVSAKAAVSVTTTP
jgi:beta-glucanase (GH16 family)